MWVLGVIAAVGAVASLIGSVSEADSRAGAAQKDAALKRMQADELLEREAINEALIREQSDMAEGEYATAFGATGREGAGIGGRLRIRNNTARTIANFRRDAEFKAKMLREGANIADSLASDAITAGYISGAGSLLQGAGKAYDAFGGTAAASTKPDSLPKVGGYD